MKTLEELMAIKEKTKEKMTVREDQSDVTRVVVGMATCGIAAGARRFSTRLWTRWRSATCKTLPWRRLAASACVSMSRSSKFWSRAKKRLLT